MTVQTTNYPSQKGTQRNMSMECAKLIASFFVVFIHIPFPGQFGSLISTLASFAVPMFFMISGYFNYQADSKTILRRAWNIFKLVIAGTMLHMFWDCICVELEGGSTIAYLRAAILDPIEVLKWIVVFAHPYAPHLWYLIAMTSCYLLFWAYTRFWEGQAIDYRPFYGLCLILFLFYFLLGIVVPVHGGNMDAVNEIYSRIVGPAMFGIGLFIREYQERIFSCYPLNTRNLLIIILGGILFSVLQWSAADVGFIPFGLFFSLIALILFMISHPTIPVKSKTAQRIILSFGPISTWVYILHLLASIVYSQFWFASVSNLLGAQEEWLRPLIVLAISFAAAVVCVSLQNQAKRLRKKRTA